MIKLILTTIFRVLTIAALAFAIGSLAAKSVRADNLDLKTDEPAISIYQGTELGTSVIVLQWLDGKTERLVIKNGDTQVYLNWFNDRLNAHESRK